MNICNPDRIEVKQLPERCPLCNLFSPTPSAETSDADRTGIDIQRVQIGPITFAISDVSNLRSGDQKLDGQITYNSCAINLDADLAPQMRRQVLWHEVLHGVLNQSGLGTISEREETLLDVLAFGIMRVLADNPSLREAP